MNRIVLAASAALALALAGGPAHADQAAAGFAKLFSDVCMAKFGHLDKVWDWAKDQHWPRLLNPEALAVFAGKPNMDGTMRSVAGGGVPGSGKAWVVREAAGNYVVATREDPESCIVWAQAADPAAVEADYAKMLTDAAKPGIDVRTGEDRTAEIPDGKVHIRVSRVWSGSALNSFALVMAAVSRSGGPFQAMLETQRLVNRDDPINPMVPLQPPSE